MAGTASAGQMIRSLHIPALMGRLILVLALLCLFTGIAAAAQLTVFTGVPPVQYLLQRLGVSGQLLLPSGQDPHTFTPTPRQLEALQDAALYISCGLPFEELLQKKLGRLEGGPVFVAADRGIMRQDAFSHRHPGEQNGADQDPHIWMSPPLLLTMTTTIVQALEQIDPGQAERYQRKSTLLSAEIRQLHKRLEAQLRPYRGRSFFVYHPAFGYFARTYGLQQRAMAMDGRQPSPRQLRRFIDRARAAKARLLFVQPQFDQRGAEAVARAMNGQLVLVDPLAYDVLANCRGIAQQLNGAFQESGDE